MPDRHLSRLVGDERREFLAEVEVEGKWQVKDTKGKPFEITLSQDGTAKGSRTEEGLNSTWKAVGNAVLITWDSEWTTKICLARALNRP
jgi:hypothetical protein